jgi:hypothetical protein
MSNSTNQEVCIKRGESYVIFYRSSTDHTISATETIIGTENLRNKLISEYKKVEEVYKERGEYKDLFEGENSWKTSKDLEKLDLIELSFEVTQMLIHLGTEAGLEDLMCNVIEGKFLA